jgi:hypothetical protein
MKCSFAVIWLLACPGLAMGQEPAAAEGTGRMDVFLRAAVLSPGPYVLDLGAAGIDQLADFPKEWDGRKGFGQRTLARVGSGFASDVIGHATAAVLHHRVLYEPCGCEGGWARVGHALSRGFVTRRDSGEVGFHTSIFVAKFGAAALATAWYPESYAGKEIVRDGAGGIAANALLNIAREYAPEIGRIFRR